MSNQENVGAQESVRRGAKQRKADRTSILYEAYVRGKGVLDTSCKIKDEGRKDSIPFIVEMGWATVHQEDIRLSPLGMSIIEQAIEKPHLVAAPGLASLNDAWELSEEGLRHLSW